jgi:hypothetical protein
VGLHALADKAFFKEIQVILNFLIKLLVQPPARNVAATRESSARSIAYACLSRRTVLVRGPSASRVF